MESCFRLDGAVAFARYGLRPSGGPSTVRYLASANSALKGAFADLSRGLFRVFGQTKLSVLLGITLAAYNLDRVP